MATGAEYEDLFGPSWGGNGKPWIEVIPAEVRQELEAIASLLDERGKPKSWQQVYDRFKKKYPDWAPTINPFKDAVKDLARG